MSVRNRPTCAYAMTLHALGTPCEDDFACDQPVEFLVREDTQTAIEAWNPKGHHDHQLACRGHAMARADHGARIEPLVRRYQ